LEALENKFLSKIFRMKTGEISGIWRTVPFVRWWCSEIKMQEVTVGWMNCVNGGSRKYIQSFGVEISYTRAE
jgi:hypothetical protein